MSILVVHITLRGLFEAFRGCQSTDLQTDWQGGSEGVTASLFPRTSERAFATVRRVRRTGFQLAYLLRVELTSYCSTCPRQLTRSTATTPRS